MSSAAVLATPAERNAANAQHSTGPVTAEGKARSARNSLQHGLTSRTVVLPHESEEDYEALKRDFEQQYQPETGFERQQVARMVDCWWKLARANRIEAEFMQQRGNAVTDANPELTGDAALVGLFCDTDESRHYRLFMRYFTAAQNNWRTALSEYRETRRARLERQLESDMVAAMLEARKRRFEEDNQVEDEDDTEDSGADKDEPEGDNNEKAVPQPVPPPQQHTQTTGFVSQRAFPAEPERPVPGQPRGRK